MGRRRALAALSFALVASSCGSSGGANEATTAAPAVATGVGSNLCAIERKTLETAVEAFAALTGGTVPTEQELVGSLLREEVKRYDIVNGAVVPVPGSGCEQDG